MSHNTIYIATVIEQLALNLGTDKTIMVLYNFYCVIKDKNQFLRIISIIS